MELVNATPFAAERVVLQDKAGRDVLVAIVKCTYAITPRGLAPSEEQLSVQLADSFNGSPGASSTAIESDLVPWKPGTDVVVIGHVTPPRDGAREVDVHVAVGPLKRTIRVFGDRRWSHLMGEPRPSSPGPIENIPLIYERAFGGQDASPEDPRDHEGEPRNPVGVGLLARRSRARIEEIPLPNIEDPAALIEDPGDRPEPAGFGFIGRGWQPRASYAGTYDAVWAARRAPRLPDDFDERFYSGAHPRLCTQRHLSGNEEVLLVHAGPGGALRFRLPGARPAVRVTVGEARDALEMAFDTLILDADALRATLVWRGRRALRGDDLLRVRRVAVDA